VLPLASTQIQYVVREPYQGGGEPLAMTLGRVRRDQALHIKSKMRHARVFLDGDHIVHEVTIGDVVSMQRSGDSLLVLGLSRNGERHEPRRARKPRSSSRDRRASA
ncbi:MAG: hypothetical protein ACRELB_09705, partial [Polyangiaceae bacterium]